MAHSADTETKEHTSFTEKPFYGAHPSSAEVPPQGFRFPTMAEAADWLRSMGYHIPTAWRVAIGLLIGMAMGFGLVHLAIGAMSFFAAGATSIGMVGFALSFAQFLGAFLVAAAGAWAILKVVSYVLSPRIDNDLRNVRNNVIWPFIPDPKPQPHYTQYTTA